MIKLLISTERYLYNEKDQIIKSTIHYKLIDRTSECFYEYDDNGNCIHIHGDTITKINTHFIYDEKGRKVKSINRYGIVEEYMYDDNDNIISTSINNHITLTYKNIYDNNNRLIISYIKDDEYNPVQTIEIKYDNNGNKIEERIDPLDTTLFTSFGSEIICSSLAIVRFEYDNNRCVCKKTYFIN